MLKIRFLSLILIALFSCSAGIIVNSDLLPKNVKIKQMTLYNDELWIATEGNGIFCINIKSKEIQNYSIKLSNLDSDIFECIAASDKYVWAGSTDGLYIFDRETQQWSKRKFSKGGEYGNWIRSLCYDPYDEVLWIGRFINLSKFDIKNNRFYDYDLTVNNEPKTNNIKMIKLDGDSVVWFGTEAGLHKFNKRNNIDIPGNVIYYNNREENLRVDGEYVCVSDMVFVGNYIWFGLDEFKTAKRPNFNLGGIYRFNRKSIWDKYDDSKGLPANGIYSLERLGHYIVASTYTSDKTTKSEIPKGIAFLNTINDSITVIKPYESEEEIKITSLIFDGQILWIGTENGLYFINFYNDFAFFNRKEE
jgi:ligand-binding sensor domain-containing protein